MPPIRRSDRVPRPKVYWEPPITTPRRNQPLLFTISTDPPESDTKRPESNTKPLDALGIQPPEPLLGNEPLDSREESQYQPGFLPKDRAGKP
jgi:hypothetical protein